MVMAALRLRTCLSRERGAHRTMPGPLEGVLACAAMVLAGCAPGNLATTATVPDATRSVFVMGLSPANADILIFDGEIAPAFKRVPPEENYEVFASSGAVFAGPPAGGYLVGEVEAGATLGFRHVYLETGVLDPILMFCDDVLTPVFTAQPGAVTYVGDFSVSSSDKGELRLTAGADFQAALEYMRLNYPALAAAMRPGEYRWLPRADSVDCTKRITIFLP